MTTRWTIDAVHGAQGDPPNKWGESRAAYEIDLGHYTLAIGLSMEYVKRMGLYSIIERGGA